MDKETLPRYPLTMMNTQAVPHQQDTDLVNNHHPVRDFGLREQQGFRSVEDFDRRFAYVLPGEHKGKGRS